MPTNNWIELLKSLLQIMTWSVPYGYPCYLLCLLKYQSGAAVGLSDNLALALPLYYVNVSNNKFI